MSNPQELERKHATYHARKAAGRCVVCANPVASEGCIADVRARCEGCRRQAVVAVVKCKKAKALTKALTGIPVRKAL